MCQPKRNRNARTGVVLLVTLVVLVVLALLAYTTTSRVAARRHRVQYLVDSAKARYALDSALKYAVIAVENLDVSLISRPNEPDFSNLFTMTDEQIAQWVANAKGASKDHKPQSNTLSGLSSGQPISTPNQPSSGKRSGLATGSARRGALDGNDLDSNEADLSGLALDGVETLVRGPYGPPWPLVAEPIEFEIGSAKIHIEIEDENAKYPLGWMLLDDPAVQRAANAGFETFCEWMGWTADDIEALKAQVAQVAEIRSFKMPSDQPGAAQAAAAAAKASTGGQAAAAAAKASTAAQAASASAPSSTGKDSSGSRVGSAASTAASSAARQAAARSAPRRADTRSMSPADKQAADMVSLVHSSLLDPDLLAKPTMVSDKRKESLSKYIGLWGTTQVNINSAPRHVLEAALAFGGDAAPLADAIIRQRQIQPIKDVSELRKTVTRYADSIEKGSKYITCASTVLSIRITAVSGAARACAVVGVVKDGKTVKTLGLVSG